jgi:mono/diheme cytochrome c family protein
MRRRPESYPERIPVSGNVAASVAGAVAVLLLTSMLAPPAHAVENAQRDSPPNQPLVEGRPLFEAKGCAHCHSIRGGEGGVQVGPDLGRSGSWRDIMQFAGSLWNHTPAMIEKMREQQVERATLSPDEMGKLAAYLFYVKFLGEPGKVERGRELFEQRSCARCHQLAGRGGTVGPRLDELKDYVSSFFLAQALWNHGPEMAAKMAEFKLARPRLEGDDVADIVALIRGDTGNAASLDLAYAQAGSPQAGKTLFREKGCLKCHAVAGTGGTVGPDLGKRRASSHVAEMAAALWNHGPPMWAKMKELAVPFPRLTDREMADLFAYLYFIQFMGENGDATKGRELFREKSCSGCHAAGGEGPKVGPDLAASDAIRSPLHWAAAMWNHTPAMEKKLHEAQFVWPRFEDDEMRDLVEFLQSRGKGK